MVTCSPQTPNVDLPPRHCTEYVATHARWFAYGCSFGEPSWDDETRRIAASFQMKKGRLSPLPRIQAVLHCFSPCLHSRQGAWAQSWRPAH